MKLMLDPPLISFPHKINYRDKILFTGSCFSDEIGIRMKDLKFSVMQNPFGILYDPLSICRSINTIIENKEYDETHLFYHGELWHSWQHHSSNSGMDRTRVINKIKNSIREAHEFIKHTNWLIITLGSSFYYELLTGDEVANCHKVPASSFNKKLLSIERNTEVMLSTIQKLRAVNPAAKIILTVSPVRHTRDGIIENNRSKARLLEVAHSLAESLENVFYFPAYELVIDVLRDHRFYKEDLVHPTTTATDYVFEQFMNSSIEKQDQLIASEIKKLLTAKDHKPFQSNTKAFAEFKRSCFLKANTLQGLYPYIDLSEEITFFG